MAKQYKVIAGAFPCLLQNKVFEGGDIIDEDFFLEGQAERGVKDLFIEEIPDEKEEKAVKKK